MMGAWRQQATPSAALVLGRDRRRPSAPLPVGKALMLNDGSTAATATPPPTIPTTAMATRTPPMEAPTRSRAPTRPSRSEGLPGGWLRTSGPQTLFRPPSYRPPGEQRAVPRGSTRGPRHPTPTPARLGGGTTARERRRRQGLAGGQQLASSDPSLRAWSPPPRRSRRPDRPSRRRRPRPLTGVRIPARGLFPASQTRPGALPNGRGAGPPTGRSRALGLQRMSALPCACAPRTCTTAVWTERPRRGQQRR